MIEEPKAPELESGCPLIFDTFFARGNIVGAMGLKQGDAYWLSRQSVRGDDDANGMETRCQLIGTTARTDEGFKMVACLAAPNSDSPPRTIVCEIARDPGGSGDFVMIERDPFPGCDHVTMPNGLMVPSTIRIDFPCETDYSAVGTAIGLEFQVSGTAKLLIGTQNQPSRTFSFCFAPSLVSSNRVVYKGLIPFSPFQVDAAEIVVDGSIATLKTTKLLRTIMRVPTVHGLGSVFLVFESDPIQVVDNMITPNNTPMNSVPTPEFLVSGSIDVRPRLTCPAAQLVTRNATRYADETIVGVGNTPEQHPSCL